MLPANYMMSDGQKLIGDIYRINNDRLWRTSELVVQLQKFGSGSITKQVRRGKQDKLQKHLAISLGWVFAICNRLHWDVGKKIVKYFPNMCPYCGQKPCRCFELRPDHRIDSSKLPGYHKPESVELTQAMFAAIYPNNTLQSSTAHMTEEISELSVDIMTWEGSHDQGVLCHAELETVDVIANLFGVANGAFINLAQSFADYYSDGCPKCYRAPCKCKFGDIANGCD